MTDYLTAVIRADGVGLDISPCIGKGVEFAGKALICHEKLIVENISFLTADINSDYVIHTLHPFFWLSKHFERDFFSFVIILSYCYPNLQYQMPNRPEKRSDWAFLC